MYSILHPCSICSFCLKTLKTTIIFETKINVYDNLLNILAIWRYNLIVRVKCFKNNINNTFILNHEAGPLSTIEDNIINLTKSGKPSEKLLDSQFVVIRARKNALFLLNHKIKCGPTSHDGAGEALLSTKCRR